MVGKLPGWYCLHEALFMKTIMMVSHLPTSVFPESGSRLQVWVETMGAADASKGQWEWEPLGGTWWLLWCGYWWPWGQMLSNIFP